MFALFAFAAEARPGHGGQPHFRDGAPATLPHAIRAFSNPIERLFNRPCKTPVGLMQANLNLHFRISVSLVNEIALPAPCCWHPGLSVTLSSRQLALFLQQQSAVSLQAGWAHDGSLWEETLPLALDSTPTRTLSPQPKPLQAPRSIFFPEEP